MFGHSSRRGSPGRALVDNGGSIVFNFGGDWSFARIMGSRLQVDGKLCVGTSDHAGDYQMYVDGSSLFTEVQVKAKANWPDYVFSTDYDLRSIDDLESFIKKEEHLPGIPSAEEIEKIGTVNVGELQTKLLEKIEELTLYIIEQNNKMEEQQARIEALEKAK